MHAACSSCIACDASWRRRSHLPALYSKNKGRGFPLEKLSLITTAILTLSKAHGWNSLRRSSDAGCNSNYGQWLESMTTWLLLIKAVIKVTKDTLKECRLCWNEAAAQHDQCTIQHLRYIEAIVIILVNEIGRLGEEMVILHCLCFECCIKNRMRFIWSLRLFLLAR